MNVILEPGGKAESAMGTKTKGILAPTFLVQELTAHLVRGRVALARVRYRGNAKRRVRSTTVEIIVEESFCDPEGYQTYEAAMSNSGQSG
jgi:hypothetical protein